MDKKHNGPLRIMQGLTPLCITLAATAMVIQDAFGSRAAASVSDEPLQPLSDWLSPVAVMFLLAGYAVSILAICFSRRGKTAEPPEE